MLRHSNSRGKLLVLTLADGSPAPLLKPFERLRAAPHMIQSIATTPSDSRRQSKRPLVEDVARPDVLGQWRQLNVRNASTMTLELAAIDVAGRTYDGPPTSCGLPPVPGLLEGL